MILTKTNKKVNGIVGEQNKKNRVVTLFFLFLTLLVKILVIRPAEEKGYPAEPEDPDPTLPVEEVVGSCVEGPE